MIIGKKYELTEETITLFKDYMLHRIKALRDFGSIKAGDLGGYIEKESNLSHNGDAWLYEDAMVYGDAQVYGNARVYGEAHVYGEARVYGGVTVHGNAHVCDNAKVDDIAQVCGDAMVYGNAEVNGNVAIGGNVWVNGNARIQSRDDLCTFGYFGSSNFYTTAFRIEGRGIGVCGYFEGTFDEFRNKVKKPHGINDYAVEDYLMIADLIENKLSGRSKN